MFSYLTQIESTGLRHPKIFQLKDELYLVASKKYYKQGEITKYGITITKLNNNFDIIHDKGFIEFNEYPYLHDITKSAWIRDINEKDGVLYMNVEIKQNVDNKRFYANNVLFSTSNLQDFTLIKIYDVTDFLFKDVTYKNDHYLFSSKIDKDNDNPDFVWGIYLFNIIKNGIPNRPIFDAIVNYDKDKGHVIHNVEYNQQADEHIMYFTIRHMVDKFIDESGFIYKVYIAKTKDLLNYYDTKEVVFANMTTDTRWYSYPCYFTYNQEEFIVCNQHDYGKYSNALIFKRNMSPEMFIANQYDNIRSVSHNELNFTTDKKYIYYNELVNKSGVRYDSILEKQENIQGYSSYAPTCNCLVEVLKRLNITDKDYIIDIGCGRGFALSLMKLFPFNTIAGIEISAEDMKICKHNLHDVLHATNIQLIQDDILSFTDYKSYNMFFLYNPFSCDIFQIVVSNMKPNDLVICKNIHDKELEVLKYYQFSLVFKQLGDERNYFVFKKTQNT